MFFVAFHRRRKQIMEQTEPTVKGKTPSELRFALVGGQENIGDAGMVDPFSGAGTGGGAANTPTAGHVAAHMEIL